MSNILHLLNFRVYVRYASVNRFLPEGLKTTCGVWYACRIMRDMMAKKTPHKDPSNYHYGFNVSTAWGDYTMARMVFWELGITIEVQKGKDIFFLLRIITHNTVDVQGGVRNVVDEKNNLPLLDFYSNPQLPEYHPGHSIEVQK